jgi:putative FmdB family regulatory protein
MPIYEYSCADCAKRSTFVTLSVRSAFEPRCQACGSANVKKLVSRVAVLRSEESRTESLADPARLGGFDGNDPGSVARWMKTMGREMGEDLGDDFEGEIDRAVAETGGGAEGGEADGTGTMEGDGTPEPK